MTLGQFLRWWLRGLRATAVAVDEALTQRRLHARDDEDLARDIAELRAFKAGPLAYRYRSIEALLTLPTVSPDRTGYTRPAQASVADVSAWIYGDTSRGFMRTAPAKVRDAAVYWLALRESVMGVRL